jgi:hypothetical protein
VDYVLRKQPGAMARLVRAELQADLDPVTEAGSDEAFGISLVAIARKPAQRAATSLMPRAATS